MARLTSLLAACVVRFLQLLTNSNSAAHAADLFIPILVVPCPFRFTHPWRFPRNFAVLPSASRVRPHPRLQPCLGQGPRASQEAYLRVDARAEG